MVDQSLKARRSTRSLAASCALLASASLGAACPPPSSPGEPPGSEATPAAELEIELAGPCETPVEGFDRLQSVAMERGLDLVLPADDSPRSCLYVPGGVVASDLDLDGDPDLLFSRPEGFPHLFSSEGGELLSDLICQIS